MGPAERRILAWIVGVCLVLGGLAFGLHALLHTSDQAEVNAGALPIVDGAQQLATFTNCSRVNSLAYFAHNPCETFELLLDPRYGSQSALLNAEDHRLLAAGWLHPRIEPAVDYDVGTAMAPIADSWYSPDHKVCAYIATDRSGVAAERQGFFPFDGWDEPEGLLGFYRAARAAQSRRIVWVRLRPPVMTEPGACS